MYLCKSLCIDLLIKRAIHVNFGDIIPWNGNAIAEIHTYTLLCCLIWVNACKW